MAKRDDVAVETDELDAVLEVDVADLIEAAMGVELVPIDELVLDPDNANEGDVPSIIDSLREFGQHRAIVAQRDTKKIVIGNHTWQAAKVLGWTHVSVHWVDDDDEKAIRRGIADNATGRRAKWVPEKLVMHLENVGTDIPGLDPKEVEKLLRDVGADKKPDAPVFPISPKINEKYDYVMIVVDNEIDAAWLNTRFELRQEGSFKSTAIGKGHVLTVERLRELGI